MITIDQFKLLAHNLLPLPDQYMIVDRQRASANGFLLDPDAERNFKELQHIKPNYQFVPKSVGGPVPEHLAGHLRGQPRAEPAPKLPVLRGLRRWQSPSRPAPGAGEGHRDAGAAGDPEAGRHRAGHPQDG